MRLLVPRCLKDLIILVLINLHNPLALQVQIHRKKKMGDPQFLHVDRQHLATLLPARIIKCIRNFNPSVPLQDTQRIPWVIFPIDIDRHTRRQAERIKLLIPPDTSTQSNRSLNWPTLLHRTTQRISDLCRLQDVRIRRKIDFIR